MSALVLAAYGFFVAWFAVLGAGQVLAKLLAYPTLKRELGLRALQDLPRMFSGFEPPVSLLLVARDAQADVAAMVEALLELDYPEYEVIVVNDGSGDGTLAELQQALQLEAFPEVYWRRLPTRPVRAIYHSRRHARVRVVDKEHGGRADALNAGINASRYPLYCAIDPATQLHPQGLRRLVAPFLDDAATAAVGGPVRIANGSAIAGGRAVALDVPHALAARVQVLEQLRGMLAAIGRSWINAELLLAGTITVFRKDIVVESGGHVTATMDERCELVARLHRVLRGRGERCKVRFVPETVAWQEVPETFAELEGPRVRAQYALAESLDRNAGLAGRGGGAAGWLGWPWMALFHGLGPLVEVAAYTFVLVMLAVGQLTAAQAGLFFAIVVGFALLGSATALALEDSWFRQYPGHRQLARLAAAALADSVFYRPMLSVWKAAGTIAWLRARRAALEGRAP